MRVLITGISGFVGSNLVRHLSSSGIRIFGHSRDVAKARTMPGNANVNFVEIVTADSINENNIDAVIHLAGIAHDLSGSFSSADYQNVNFAGTKKVFDEFLKSAAKKIIFISSIKAVGEGFAHPITEATEAQPSSPYGKSKRQAEMYILSHTLSASRNSYIFRPCMIHGEGNKGNLNLLYRFVKSDIPFPLGGFQNQRSFLSVNNLSFVIEKFLTNNFTSGIYNVADTGTLSTNELVAIIADALNRKARVWNLPQPAVRLAAKIGSVMGLPFNSSRLEKLTENMIVANDKVVAAMGCPLPVSLREGLYATLRSFK